MDIATIPGIALIVYLAMELFAREVPKAWKPPIAGAAGIALGVASYFTMPEVHESVLAAAILGLLGAASAAGVNGTVDSYSRRRGSAEGGHLR